MKTRQLLSWLRAAQAHRRAAQRVTPLEQRRVAARRRARLSRWAAILLIGTGVLGLLVGLPWLVWRGPYAIDAQYLDRRGLADGSAALVTGLRTAVVAGVAALGAGIALLYTARNYRLTRRGQITERFTKALERLGSDQQYVRIGGILALEQIVRDAPEQAATDAARVLGHFIRDRTPRSDIAIRRTITDNEETSTADSVAPYMLQEIAADIQEALTALTRIESRIHVDAREVIDLHDLHLAGVKLNDADLTGANLSAASLDGVDLSRAVLTEANLSDTSLVRANMRKATLIRANLLRASLTAVDLFEADLSEATLFTASLNEAHLEQATFDRADLSASILDGANLSEASLVGATISAAEMYRTNLSKANLRRANLQESNLTEADLTEANLEDADLSGATVRGTILSGPTTVLE